MDDIALDYYDPRNASFYSSIGFPAPPPPPPAPTVGFGGFRRPFPKVPPRFVAPPMASAPPSMPYLGPVYAPPGYGYAPAAPALPFGRRLLRDVTIGDVLSMLAVGATAFRSLPDAPDDARDVDTNVVNQTAFLASIASHFKTDSRIAALGTIARTLLG